MFRRSFQSVIFGRTFFKRGALRRGMSAPQAALVLVLIAVAAFIALRSLGTNTASDLEETAGGVADPAQLVDRFQ